MITLDPRSIDSINAVIRELDEIEQNFYTFQYQAPMMFIEHLTSLGERGVQFIEHLIKDDTGSEAIGSGWTYELTREYIRWYHRRGEQVHSTGLSINSILHLLDEGTEAHGPVTAQFLHFYGRKQYAGQEYFLKSVAGIKARRYMNKLKRQIRKMHRELIPRLEAEFTRIFA